MSQPSSTPEFFNLAEYVIGPGPLRPDDQIALTMLEEESVTHWTWYRVRKRVAAWQTVLHNHGINKGDRIVLFLANRVDVPALLLASAAHGIISVVLSPQLSTGELEYIVQHSGAALCITEDPRIKTLSCALLRPSAVDDIDLPPNDEPTFHHMVADTPGYMVYTSGTTGHPRGVLHAHRAVRARQPMFEGWTGITRDDIVLHAGQLNWTYAMGIAVFDAWCVGARSIIYEGPRNAQRWAQLFETHQPTIFAAVPGIYRQLLRDVPQLQERTASLRHALCAGEALPATLWHSWRQTTGKELYEALGMSECSTYISSGPATPTRPGSPGRPQAGRHVAILPLEDKTSLDAVPDQSVGMLAIHRDEPGLMLEYFNAPDAMAQAFRGPWFLTGDLAAFDEDGYLHFFGRSDDTINALGYRVGPVEVESVLSRHPSVQEAAVAASTVREGVTLICAHLVLRPSYDWSDALEASLRTHCSEHLAAYKCPQLYRVYEALPRNRSGKVLRRALRETL